MKDGGGGGGLGCSEPPGGFGGSTNPRPQPSSQAKGYKSDPKSVNFWQTLFIEML